MNRWGLAAAVVAALALATAAGSFAATDGSTLHGGDTLGGSGGGDNSTEAAGGGVGGSGVPVGVPVPGFGGGLGGSSPLFGAVFAVALLVCAGLAVALTGDDDRAPPPDGRTDESADDESGGEDSSGSLDVDPRYGTPEDNTVVRAWSRVTEAAGADESRTPGETARAAADRGLPSDAVATITEQFRAVRYDREPVDDRRAETAAEALERLEREGNGDDPPDVDRGEDR